MSFLLARQTFYCDRLIFQKIPVINQINLRFKSSKGHQRKKLPAVEKQREKWISANSKSQVVKMSPKNFEEKVLNRKPIDDVWFRAFYGPMKHSFIDAIMKHREVAQPHLLNNMDGFIYVYFELDFSTKKKTKFMNESSKVICLPHLFFDGVEHSLLAFCRTAEEKDAAIKSGAKFAGGSELMKMIEKGEIYREEYDYVVTTTDFASDLVKMRKMLKDDFPVKINGTIGESIVDVVNTFVNGRELSTKVVSDGIGKTHFVIGTLDMSLEQLEENYNVLLEGLCSMKKYNVQNFIQKAIVFSPPSPEKLHLNKSYLLAQSLKQSNASIVEDAV